MIIFREIDNNGDLIGEQATFCSGCDIPKEFENESKYEYYNSTNWPTLKSDFQNDNCLYCDSCNKRLLKCFYLDNVSNSLDCAVYDSEHYPEINFTVNNMVTSFTLPNLQTNN